MTNRIKYTTLHTNLLSSLEQFPTLGLAYGKIGISIYFYILSRIENNQRYQDIGEKLLNDVINNLSQNQNINIETGLSGIALGIRYLIKNGYETGDVNEVLEDIDAHIYKILLLSQSYPDQSLSLNSFDVIQLLFYFCIRLKDLPADSDNAFLFKCLINQLINSLGIEISNNYLKEASSYSLYEYNLPFLLYVLNEIEKHDVRNGRMEILLQNTVTKVLSHRPLLHSNRLFLLWGMLSIRQRINSSKWDNYIQNLHEHIDLLYLFEHEIKNQDLFFSNGIASIYMLLKAVGRHKEFAISFDAKEIEKQIVTSRAWDTLLERDSFFKRHKGLLNGFPSTILVLNCIKKDYTI
jgi:hypothetical protein